MKRFSALFAVAILMLGFTATKALSITIGLPIKEVRSLIDVSSVDVAVKKGYAKIESGSNPATRGGQYAIDMANKMNVPLSGKTVVYNLTSIDTVLDIAGVEFPVWVYVPDAFAKDSKTAAKFKNPHGPVPGPEVIADVGDLVRINFTNKSANFHTIHIHGPILIHYSHDGTMNVAQLVVKLNEQFTYEFVAKEPGSHIYHCHVNANEHMDMGLYGAIIIHGPNDPKVDQDVLAIIDEWDSKFSKEEGFAPSKGGAKQSAEVGTPRRIASFNLFTINGNAWTDEYPNVILGQTGQKVRVRFINMGTWPHNVHVHGHTVANINYDGYPVEPPQLSDSAALLPGDRKDYLIDLIHTGRYAWHCHFVPHATNDGVYHGGMLMAIVYLEPGPGGKLYPAGVDIDAHPLGKPNKIGGKAWDAV